MLDVEHFGRGAKNGFCGGEARCGESNAGIYVHCHVSSRETLTRMPNLSPLRLIGCSLRFQEYREEYNPQMASVVGIACRASVRWTMQGAHTHQLLR